jgi:hypothetical protein
MPCSLTIAPIPMDGLLSSLNRSKARFLDFCHARRKQRVIREAMLSEKAASS